MRTLLIAATLVFGAGSTVLAAPSFSDTDAGSILTGDDGMTLYTFDADEQGTSNCYDDCAANWPPYVAEDGASAEDPFSLVERNDGSMQWAYDGQPLYYWVNDSAAGDTTGDGIGGAWHIVTE